MHRAFEHSGIAAIMLAVLVFSCQAAAQSPAVDFSCMTYSVKGKTQVSERYKEYDVILQNRCPGSVYWSMCIERVDPWSHQTIETHNPSGYIEKDKRSRVNLQMKKGPETRFRNRFQEFFVNVGYSINSTATAECGAARCESNRRQLRTDIQANEDAWQKATAALEARVTAECPESGWDGAVKEGCAAEIRASNQQNMTAYAEKDQSLRQQMTDVVPVSCRVYGGALVPSGD
jgi:hypothetical protein